MTLVVYFVLMTGGMEIESYRVAGQPHCEAKGGDIVRANKNSLKYWAVYFECVADDDGVPL